MKILMVTNDFLPLNPGGVANHIFELSKALVQQGHQVMVLHLCYCQVEPLQENQAGIEIVRCCLARDLAAKKSHFAKLWRYVLSFTKGAQAIKQWIRAFKPDVVHWHDFYHTSLAMRRVHFKGRKVLTNHASDYLKQFATGGFWHKYLRFLAQPADILIAPSQELADKSNILHKPVYFISNGVDVARFQPLTAKSAARKKYCAEENFLLVAPRRLDPKNGLNYLILALPLIKKIIPEVKLIIAGGGNAALQEEYYKLARTQNVADQLLITGNLAYAEMPLIIGSADLIVIPSLQEAVSLAALEAMACAVPIVASNVGGLPLIIDETVGRLVPPADPTALAQAIIELQALSAESSGKMGAAARKRVVENFTWQAVATKTMQIYGEQTK